MNGKIIVLVGMSCLLVACQAPRSVRTPGAYALAVNTGNRPKPAQYLPVPMPLEHLPSKGQSKKAVVGEEAIEEANKKAVRQPTLGEHTNSTMNYNYFDGAIYPIYCAPYNITDVQFQANEHIVAVGAGDTARWNVTKSYSGIGANRREHLFIKPLDEELENGVVVTTDLRTYHLKLKSTNKTSMASVAWRYPDSGDDNILLTNLDDDLSSEDSNAATIDLHNLNYNYQISLGRGTKKSMVQDWFPKAVFNDGHKTYIQFPENMQEAPNLFVGIGKNRQVINYRVQGNYYVIDGVVAEAQLVLSNASIRIIAKK